MEKRLTDNEIIKALEWLESKTKEYCEQCAYKNSEVCDICIFDKIKLALDLINRLKAENERLSQFCGVLLRNGGELFKEIETAKAEVYKECLEELLDRIFEDNDLYERCAKGMCHQEYQQGYAEKNDQIIRHIQNLLKRNGG